jgi:hypothetical protein
MQLIFVIGGYKITPRERGLAYSDSMRVGVVLERRRLNSPWQDHAWLPVAVVPGVPAGEGGRVLREGEGWRQVYAGDWPIELFRKETASYRFNLASAEPRVYVVLRRDGDAELPWRPILVTVAADEAQAMAESGEDIVEGVPMPDTVRAWVEAFVAEHHVEEPFYKRRRKPHRADAPGGEG